MNSTRLDKYIIWRKRQRKLQHIVEGVEFDPKKRECALTLLNKQKLAIKKLFL